MKKNKKIIYLLLGLIILLAAFLRLYRLGQVPPSLSWDEAANGYNAYSIAHWGKDEWGKTFPLYFKSFEDDKNPVHIYLTAISVKLLGLTEFPTRLPMAILGVFNVILLFFLGRFLFKSNLVGLLAALFLAISPYNLQFSRFNHEANVALFFFLLGLVLFYKSLAAGNELLRNKLRSIPSGKFFCEPFIPAASCEVFWFKNKLLPLSFLFFGISILSYHSAKIVVPAMAVLLTLIYFRQLWRIKAQLIISYLILLIFALIIWLNPALLGISRMNQLSIPIEKIHETNLYKSTNSELLGRVEWAWGRYRAHFAINYLFVSGDGNARHSTQSVGEFYKIDALFLIIGLLGLVLQRGKSVIVLVAWALLAPIPATFSGDINDTGHAARALFTMGSWHLISAFGFYKLINLFKITYLKVAVLAIGLFILGWQFKDYINYYYGEYSRRYAIEWQYGMKQIAGYVQDHNGYFRFFMTDVRSQPYIFFLYYLTTPLPKFLETVGYNTGPYRPSNLVQTFENYHFGDWDPIKSSPDPGVLYILSPSQYDGLVNKNIFDVKKKIQYPDGADAFFLVSYP